MLPVEYSQCAGIALTPHQRYMVNVLVMFCYRVLLNRMTTASYCTALHIRGVFQQQSYYTLDIFRASISVSPNFLLSFLCLTQKQYKVECKNENSKNNTGLLYDTIQDMFVFVGGCVLFTLCDVCEKHFYGSLCCRRSCSNICVEVTQMVFPASVESMGI